jgi:hypothetical protein
MNVGFSPCKTAIRAKIKFGPFSAACLAPGGWIFEISHCLRSSFSTGSQTPRSGITPSLPFLTEIGKQAASPAGSSTASRPATAISAISSHVVRLSSTVETIAANTQTSKVVTNASFSGPWVLKADRAASATMPTARNSANNPPPTRMERTALCAVSTEDNPAALTNEPAPVPSSGALVNASHPADQMFKPLVQIAAAGSAPGSSPGAQASHAAR